MGEVVASLCRSCGFKNEFRIGGGKFEYKTYCPVPAINKQTLEFQQVNYYEHKNSNEYLNQLKKRKKARIWHSPRSWNRAR